MIAVRNDDVRILKEFISAGVNITEILNKVSSYNNSMQLAFYCNLEYFVCMLNINFQGSKVPMKTF